MKKLLFLISIVFFSATLSFAQNSVEDKNKSETDALNSPVKIIDKPNAAYPNQDKGAICITGSVILRVTFLDSGKIGKIDVVSGLPYGANENAVEAAKKIKFKPARKNGKVVSVSKIVMYYFGIY